MFHSEYKDYEVGRGWVDPRRLAQRLTAGLRFFPGGTDSPPGVWLGAIAFTLVILSWWHDLPVPDVVAWLVQCVQELLQ